MPVLGSLFRRRAANADQRVPLVMLRPRIVSTDAEAAALAGIEYLVRKVNGLGGIIVIDNKIFIMPTCEAMVLAVKYYHEGKLPGVEGIHMYVGKKQRSMWRDRLGHLGPGFDRLEGYVFYATLYGRSPEKIEGDINFGKSDYPNQELDRMFRKIAWEAVLNNPLSGVVDKDGNGVADDRQ